jgi:hypothetical protein
MQEAMKKPFRDTPTNVTVVHVRMSRFDRLSSVFGVDSGGAGTGMSEHG